MSFTAIFAASGVGRIVRNPACRSNLTGSVSHGMKSARRSRFSCAGRTRLACVECGLGIRKPVSRWGLSGKLSFAIEGHVWSDQSEKSKLFRKAWLNRRLIVTWGSSGSQLCCTASGDSSSWVYPGKPGVCNGSADASNSNFIDGRLFTKQFDDIQDFSTLMVGVVEPRKCEGQTLDLRHKRCGVFSEAVYLKMDAVCF